MSPTLLIEPINETENAILRAALADADPHVPGSFESAGFSLSGATTHQSGSVWHGPASGRLIIVALDNNGTPAAYYVSAG